MNDEPDPILNEPGDTGTFGARFSIGTTQLKPLSHGHRAAFFRVCTKLDVRGDEMNIVLLYCLTKGREEMASLRDEKAYLKTIVDATEWAEQFKIADINRVADEIWQDYEKANAIEPAKTSAAGND